MSPLNDDLRAMFQASEAARLIDEMERQHRDEFRTLLRDLLNVLDALDRVIHTGRGNRDSVKSLEMIRRQFQLSLEKTGVVSIPTVGSPFDPERHEVVEQITCPEAQPGSILKEYAPGYLWRDAILRCAKVGLAKQ